MTQVELPVGWQWKSIGEVCRVIPGFAFKSKDWTDTGIPVIKIKNIQADCSVNTSECDFIPSEIFTEKLNKFVARKGDILIAMTGATAGKVGRISSNERFLINQRVAKLEPETIGKDFFWGVVSGRHYQELFFNLADGAAQPNMSGKQIEGVRIPVPPPQAQEKISLLIGSYDDLIENNTRRIEILEEMARRLYEEWFVQFRFPGHEGAGFEDGDLGRIPKAWSQVSLKDVCDIKSGYAFKSSSFHDRGDYHLVTIKNVQDGYFVRGCTNRIKEVPGNVPAHAFLKDGDILLSLTGNVGRVCLVHGGEFLLNQRVAKLIAKPGYLKPFVYCMFRDCRFRDRMERLSSGVAQQNLSPVQVGEIVVVMPSRELLESFCAIIKSHLDLVVSLQNKNANLRAQRDLLLPKLISGEIDVSDIPMPT